MIFLRTCCASHRVLGIVCKHVQICANMQAFTATLSPQVAEVTRAMELGREAAAYVSEKFIRPVKLEFEKASRSAGRPRGVLQKGDYPFLWLAWNLWGSASSVSSWRASMLTKVEPSGKCVV